MNNCACFFLLLLEGTGTVEPFSDAGFDFELLLGIAEF
jgi:hypothetical protein